MQDTWIGVKDPQHIINTFLIFTYTKKKNKKIKKIKQIIQYKQSIVHQHRDPFHNHIKETLKEFLNT